MAQHAKKTRIEVNMFWNLRHQLAEEAKKSGDPNVPNFKNALVDICWSSSEKQKGAPPTQRGVGKERKNLLFEKVVNPNGRQLEESLTQVAVKPKIPQTPRSDT
ncbi:hypothetical protein DEO72_LG6g1438 [Vigna unguiculata]|uniref:Uncharacterized protein n=1 Tax=Vigna unguiculata TaxID=3917 RepID=A0A4D6M5R7_VIGUN|nr:hypothetical protein DEO72_LG6g1438 [Vigna unguiculata]